MADNVIGTGVVLVKPNLDQGALSDVEAKGGSAGSGFGTAFSVAAGNLISSAVTAIAGAAVQVFADAFSNYADYEQLVGGVDTMFKESSEIVQKNAQDAYRTAGISANQYMEQVTSFSASLLQGLGGDTEAAAAYADMAIRDMSDNANKFGTDMASIQNAYQGFAKGNYTMLDNLKLGYGGTKQEMERLLADASELAGVEFDIDNYNDVIEAIHVMQENMDIAGTTALEASSTISGSIGKLGAAWDNFLTGIFDDNADLGALGERLLDALGDVLGNVVPRLAVMVKRVFEGLPTAIMEVINNIPVILAPAIMEVFGEELSTEITDSVFETFDNVVSTITGAVEYIDGLFQQAWPVIEQYVSMAMEGIDAFMKDIWPGIQVLVQTVMESISRVVQAVWPVIMNIWSTSLNFIKGVTETVWPYVSQIVKFAMDTIGNAVTSITSIVEVVSSVFNAVVDAVKGPMENAKEIVKTIIETIKGFFGFEVTWPHIPMPHFSISPEGWKIDDLLKGSIPSLGIEWYAKGGIIDGATLIGAGESGPEAIVPLTEPNLAPFADAVAKRMGSGITVNNMTVVTPDPEDFMRQLTAFASRTRAQYA